MFTSCSASHLGETRPTKPEGNTFESIIGGAICRFRRSAQEHSEHELELHEKLTNPTTR